jgi:hypothetical protein
MPSALAVVADADFQLRVLESLKAAKIGVQQVLRVYPAFFARRDNIEVCYINTDGKPQTVYVDADGQLVQGPFEGFGNDEAA